jgi:hypothetical protein
MKVTGPGSAPPEGPGASDAQPISKAGKPGAPGAERPEATGRTFAETLAAGRPAQEPAAARARSGDGASEPAHGVRPSRGVDPVTSDIAADLKAGKIDPKAALDRVVERVLDQQLGPNAPSALRDQLRDSLRDTIGGDPFLAERLRGLGGV